ncbi:phage tail tube protein [Actinoplanes palleronii]|uniref:Phage tail protein n=1 Tax=Actinoplanes palleronii TaxID=113570 RepID=A0ABQ4B410_9ACTN|nr:phage tail tube protein [Actinoplanes palleronii]GIE65406.1 hypothetical protein Apa02nite_015140 [Actinoplanes palleronii]
MAKSVLLASFISVNATDLSAFASKIELKVECEDQDVTTFASGGWNERLAGLKSFELSVTWKQDTAVSQLDQQLWTLFGTLPAFEVRLSNAVVGTSNPKYTGNVLIKEHSPIAGSVGDVAEMDVSYPGSGALARATA